MEDEKAATVTEPVATEEGFVGAAKAAETTSEPAATVPTETEGTVTDEVKEEPKAPGTYEEFEASERHQTLLSEAKTAAVEEAKPDLLREAKSAAFREFDPFHQKAEAHLGNLAKTGQGINRSLRDSIEGAVEAGGDAKQIGRAIQRVIDDNPGFIDMVNSTMYGKGQDQALRKLAAESGDPNLLPDVYLRLRNDPDMGDEGFAREVLDRLTEARMGGKVKEAVEKAVKPKD